MKEKIESTQLFIKEKITPTDLENYCSYYTTLRDQTLELQKKLSDIWGKESDVYKEYYSFRQKLLKIYICYEKGNIQSASTSMRNLLFGKKGIINNLRKTIEKGSSLYRYRKENDLSKRQEIAEKYTEKLFHIPFDKREEVKNYRYSISGFPCLYLADSGETCIAELRATANEKSTVGAQYITKSSLEYYDLSINEENINTTQEMIYYLKKFLIIFACSYRMKKEVENVYYVPCYVIPQMITASISASKSLIKCIGYRSTRCEGYNYVFIPHMKDYKTSMYDEDLKGKFDIKLIKDGL